jgi:hypothetical protein
MTTPRFRCLLADQTAYLYDENAGRLDEARFEFPLMDDQEVPRLPPEFVVAAEGGIAEGEQPMFEAAGVRIAPARPLRKSRGTGRLLVERGDVVAHPALLRPADDWRYPLGHSFDSVDDWNRFLRRSLHSGRVGVLMSSLPPLAISIVSLVLFTSYGFRERFSFAFALLFLMLTVWFWIQARQAFRFASNEVRIGIRARRSLRRAKALPQTDGQPMFMRLWWSAGHGHGPVAVASLFSSENSVAEETRVAVVGIAREMLSDDRVRVVVYGRTSDSPVIALNDVTLWPADRAIRATKTANG